MLATIHVSRTLRRRVTLAAIVLMIPIAYWPVGEYLEGALTPAAYFLWVVVGLPAILVFIFAVNAYYNVREDMQLESRGSGAGETTAAGGGGDD